MRKAGILRGRYHDDNGHGTNLEDENVLNHYYSMDLVRGCKIQARSLRSFSLYDRMIGG
jgi:hypothetical protein